MATIKAPPGQLVTAIKKAHAGDTIAMEGGTYKESVSLTPPKGTSHNKIRILGDPEALITGTFALTEPEYFGVDGNNMKISNPTLKHMAKITGGDGWWFTDVEQYGGKGYSNLLIQTGKGEGNFYVARVTFHGSTGDDPTHDHLLYCSGRNGLIEMMLGWNNTSGSMFKLGSGSCDDPGPQNVEIRNSTGYDSGEAGFAVSWGANGCSISRCIMVKTAKKGAGGYHGHQLRPDSVNTISESISWDTESSKIITNVTDKSTCGYGGGTLKDGGGNLHIDPIFDKVTGIDGFRPLNPAAQFAGRWAALHP